MKDKSRTKPELIEENSALKQRIKELEQLEPERKKVEQNRDQLAAIIESAPDFIGFADARTKRLSYINQAGRRMCGIGEHEDINALQIANVHPEWANRLLVQKILPEAVQEGIWQGECAFVDRNGLEIPVLMVLMAHRSGTGDVDFFSTISRNITDRKHAEEALRRAHDELEQRIVDRTEKLRRVNEELQTEITDRMSAEEALRESEERYRNLFTNASEAIFVAQDGKLVFINPMTTKMIGYSGEDLMSRSFVEFIHPDDRGMVIDRHVKRLKGEELPQIYSFQIVRRDGKVIWVDLNTVVVNWRKKPATLNFLSDITDRKRIEEALRESEKKYRELSIIDDLTQIYNSRYFYQQLRMEIDRVNRYGQPLTLLLLDLDDFKVFNDAYGHVEGDQVLLRVGQVIKRWLRQTDSTYRYGGEEFTILLPMTTSVDGTVTAERIRTEFKKEIFISESGEKVHMTMSIGLAQYRPQEDMRVFVHRVDQLMYQGKKNGKDRVCSES